MSQAVAPKEPLEYGIGDDPIVYSLRLYVQYLQGLFNFMPKGTFHWEPDDNQTEIVIRAQAPISSEVVGKRPAITVVMGPYQYGGIGIDNFLSLDKNGKKVRTDLINGHLVVYCIADSDIIANRLAHIVSHHTRVNQRLLESPGGFHQICRPGPIINSPSPPGALISGDPLQLVMVQVNIPYAVQWTWQTTPKQNPNLRSLDMITSKRRASEYEYQEPSTIRKVKLAMHTSPVMVKKIRGTPSLSSQTESVTIHPGINNFQLSGLEPFQDEE